MRTYILWSNVLKLHFFMSFCFFCSGGLLTGCPLDSMGSGSFLVRLWGHMSVFLFFIVLSIWLLFLLGFKWAVLVFPFASGVC